MHMVMVIFCGGWGWVGRGVREDFGAGGAGGGGGGGGGPTQFPDKTHSLRG